MPKDDEELKIRLKEITGLTVSDTVVCPNHTSPFRALADAFFVRNSISVWEASRGFGGKSIMLAALGMMEAVCYGASVKILGGSGEQSKRVHDYMVGDDPNMLGKFWANETAPKWLLVTDPTKTETKLNNGGRISVLMASQRSTRGPHPQKLLCVSGDAFISMPDGNKEIRDCVQGNSIYSLDKAGNLILDEVIGVACIGQSITLDIYFSDGSILSVTPNHKIWTDAGWKYASEIHEQDICFSFYRNKRVTVLSVAKGKITDVWDITVKQNHNFFANGILVHNCDEADEMDIEIFDAAMGQTMEARGIKPQTVISSTHQHADGTMTEILRRAKENKWGYYSWCWKENLAGGWLTQEMVDTKKKEVTKEMWETEYDLQEPNPGVRAINTAAVNVMFDSKLGSYKGQDGELIIAEPYDPAGTYSTGADWAKDNDYTVIVTLRIDTQPARMVAFLREHRLSWPVMVEHFNARVKAYPGNAAHDETGIGGVINDYLTVGAVGHTLGGVFRKNLLTAYIVAIEQKTIVAPMIEWCYNEHKNASQNDLYGTGHLPDSICASALAYWGANFGSWVIGAGG